MNKRAPETNGKSRISKRLCLWILIAVFVFAFPYAGADNVPSVMSSSIYKTDWRWNPGETAEFEGNIICDHVNEDNPLIISLSADVASDEAEVSAPVFRYVNGKKQSNRHPKSEVTVSASNQAIRFSGGWELPKDVRIDEATIHLKIYNQQEELLAESELRMKNDHVVAGGSGYRFPELSKPILYILIAAGAIWILAAIRIFINRKRRQ